MARNKESSWQKAAVLGLSPSAFAAAGVQGWGGECGSSCAMGHQNLESPALPQPPCHPLTSALWTGRAGRRVTLLWTALGRQGEATPAGTAGHLGCCRGPSGLAEKRGGCNKSELGKRDAGSGRTLCHQHHSKQPKSPCPGTQHYRAATSPRSDSSLRLCPP